MSTTPNALPESLEDLTEGDQPLTKEIPTDPWGNPYVYRKIDETEFEIFSVGPDGVEGTDDDVRLE